MSPVLVIHGMEDDMVDFSHGVGLYERAPNTVEPLWVPGAGHNDIEEYPQFFERLWQFLYSDLAK